MDQDRPRPFCLRTILDRLKRYGVEGDEQTAHSRMLLDLLEATDALSDKLRRENADLNQRLREQKEQLERTIDQYWAMEEERDNAQRAVRDVQSTAAELLTENTRLRGDLDWEGKRRVLYQDLAYRTMNHIDAVLGRRVARGCTLDTFEDDIREALLRQGRYEDEDDDET